MGVSRICARRSWQWSVLPVPPVSPLFLAIAFRLPGANSTSGNAKTYPFFGSEFTPADLPLTNSSTDCVLAIT